jgi:ElaB/YqjD/DUF883 family membrane-anchored ribosome-binding protein
MYSATKEDSLSNLKSSAKSFSSVASEVADDAKVDLRAAANSAGRQVRQFINSASDEMVSARDAVTDQIRSKPVQSSLIALGVGVVLGALIRR